ncbi:MAG: TIGR02281 family clan AA aspartic protease, partial [Pseudomonadota bacterium]
PHTLNFSGRSKTANGIARVAPVVLDRLSVGDITVKNVQALVSEPGKLSINLLGMSFMKRLNRVQMEDGKLLLVQ